MANTTNFNWETPDDTDLVKDGAAAIRTLGSAIDTSLVDLKGGTTGQILSKATNTDMDFTWVSDATGIPATIFDAKGDIIAASAADTAARLAVGTNGHVLTADSTTATGLKWASAGAAATSYSLINTGGTSLSGTTTTISSLSGYNKLFILTNGISTDASSPNITIRFNSDTGNNYSMYGGFINATDPYARNSTISASTQTDISYIIYAVLSSYSTSAAHGYIEIDGANSSGIKTVKIANGVYTTSGVEHRNYTLGASYKGTSVISSISFISDSGSFDAGTVYIYGAN